jgi:hypothetical protein
MRFSSFVADPNKTHEHNTTTATFLDGTNIVSYTPATGQSAVTQMQKTASADGVVPNLDHLQGISLKDHTHTTATLAREDNHGTI